MAVLDVEGLHSGYGELPVLQGVDLEVDEQESAAVLGLNGAGKTTLLLALAGKLDVWEGDIRFEGSSVKELSVSERVERGMVLVPEGRRVFASLTVAQNLRVGAWTQSSDAAARSEEQVFETFPILAERRNQTAGTMSGGEQQQLAIGRALMASPKLLMIDEGSLGLAPTLVSDLFERIGQITASGVTVLLVEQNVGVLDVIDRAYVMEKGAIVYSGTREEIGEGEKIRKTYLGVA